MAMRDEDFGTALTLTEGDGAIWSPPMSASPSEPRDWRSAWEQAQARADAAEARAEELRWAEVAARSDAGAWKSRFKACWQRLSEAEQETGDLRRAVRDVPSLQAEVTRLQELLSGVRSESSEFRTMEALRDEVARLHKALASKARKEATGPLSRENARLRRELKRSQGLKATIRRLSDEAKLLRGELAGYHDQMDIIAAQSREAFHLRMALIKSDIKKQDLEARLAERPLLPAAVRGLRQRDRTIGSLRARNERLEEELAKLLSSRAVLSKAVFGSRSERRKMPGPARPATAAPRASGDEGTTQPAKGCAHPFLLRQALCHQRRALHEPHRDRGQGPHPEDRPAALAPGLRLRVLAPGGDCAAGAAAVPRNALRNRLLGTVPVRALCVPAPAVPGRGVVRGPGGAGLAGHAGRQPEALRAAVRPALRGDPGAPEPDGGAPRRRDRLAGAGAPRERPVEPRLAVDFGQQGRGLLPYRPLARRRGRQDPVRRHRLHRVRGLRPLRRLQIAGARARRQGDPVLVLEPPAARLHRVYGRPGGADRMVPGMDRAGSRSSTT